MTVEQPAPTPLDRLAFETRLARRWLPRLWQQHHSLLAVSGGPDSTALAVAMCRLSRDLGVSPFTIVHINHQWRGQESERDERFVRKLAERLEIPCICHRLEVTTGARGESREGWARRLRYERLLETARQTGARYVLTGHTRDDQIETVLMRIFRGTGVYGLAGMRQVRQLDPHVSLVRPLLWASRKHVIRYLQQVNQDWCIDSTNPDLRLARGFLRSQLLPTVRCFFGSQAHRALLRLAKDAAEMVRVVDQVAQGYLDACQVRRSRDAIVLDRRAWNELPEVWQRFLIRKLWQEAGWPQNRMSRVAWKRLTRYCRSKPTGQYDFPGMIRVRLRPDTIHLVQLSP